MKQGSKKLVDPRTALQIDASGRMKISPARSGDIPSLEHLIPLSVRSLQSSHYSSAQMEAAIGSVFGVDRQLIDDCTYFVVREADEIIGCGGWSRRKKLFGSDALTSEGGMLDPGCDSARIRAFFVHPEWARRGVGRMILTSCEEATCRAQFRSAELVATLSGEPFYAAFGYGVEERYEVPLPGGLFLPVVRMTKAFHSNIAKHQKKPRQRGCKSLR